MGEKVVSIFAGLTVVALVAVLVQSPHTAKVVNAFGDAYANSVKAVTKIG